MISCQRSAATRQIKKKMADREDELETVEVDHKLLERQKFALYKDLEGYCCPWDASYVPSKDRQQKGKGSIERKKKKRRVQPHSTDQSCAQDSANLQLYILVRDKLLTHPAKDATKGFNLQFTDVARQVERQCCPYYRSFTHNFHPTFNRRKFHGCR